MVRRVLLLSSLAILGTGCKAAVGECNLEDPFAGPAALSVAYRASDGLPMIEGQALVQSTCGNGAFCHSPAAVRADRFGVPKGLDFDLSLACNDQDPSCAGVQSCNVAGGSQYCTDLARLEANQRRTLGLAQDFVTQVKSGAMPPGKAGQRVRDLGDWVRGTTGTALPSIDSKDGREIVRNWVACGAPVIARTEEAPDPDNPPVCGNLGESECECQSVDEEFCVLRGPVDIPDPTWSSIFFEVVLPQCVTCHGPANGNADANPARSGQPIPGGASPAGLASLDLSGANLTDTSGWASGSHSAVVGVAATSIGLCAGQGTLIVPGDPGASLLIDKLRDEQTCGDPMPQNGDPLLNDVISVIEQWVLSGAAND